MSWVIAHGIVVILSKVALWVCGVIWIWTINEFAKKGMGPELERMCIGHERAGQILWALSIAIFQGIGLLLLILGLLL